RFRARRLRTRLSPNPCRAAGTRAMTEAGARAVNPATAPVLVFDSGIGGLTVLREARVLMPDRRFVYVADDAAFPYGAWKEKALRAHILTQFAGLLDRYRPALSVIACNTASTL